MIGIRVESNATYIIGISRDGGAAWISGSRSESRVAHLSADNKPTSRYLCPIDGEVIRCQFFPDQHVSTLI